MKQLVNDFPKHLQQALEIGHSSNINVSGVFNNIVICGLGGSGIGGKIVSELMSSHCRWPVHLHNTYELPTFAGPETLVIISSYSGNTEETVSAMRLALQRGCQVCSITSGGEVLDLSKKFNLSKIIIPGGNPPRSMLGFSLTSLLFIANSIGAIDSNFATQVGEAADMLLNDHEAISADADAIANALLNKLPVIYSSVDREGLAIRWRQQLNENSKMLCWHHVLPEMNHNELVGWEGPQKNVIVVVLRDEDDNERIAARMDICKKIFSKTNEVIEVEARGTNPIAKALYTIHLGDLISVMLAEKQGVDPMTIDNIDLLKNTLAEL